jgi:uncharacterized protein (DUF924 family)
LNDVLDFWFDPASRRHWFDSAPDFDRLVAQRLGGLHADAAAGRLDPWQEQPDGALALCILLDQVPRNIFRGTARAFASDPAARAVARRILASGFDLAYPTDDHRLFCYLPFEHSEDIEDQWLSVTLFSERTADRQTTDYARRHCDIIRRFGRFPHRNEILGRPSTPEERDFLKQPGSAF